MAVIKVFDAVGVKTLVLAGNAQDQPYDEEELTDEEINESAEETDDGF